MTLEEFIKWMESGIGYDWEEDCQFPYQCQSDCCQRMREEKVEKYYTLHLESLDHTYLTESVFHCFYSGMALHDSPVEALTRVICDSAKVEKIESGNLPKVLRTCTQSHSIEGYYRVETTVKQITGEDKTFIGFYAVCKW